ncbi:serine/threonine-protein kinase [Pseudomaricurvus sp. HS19]|uniref:serine/threonine-protein kinase n=1 Tax=Pseudomaricurvus sp. HS19 TaxID=2692626 RepID=UPI00136BFF7D|nr:serine/threonine-protein kinase [Pseudomaricurvus sp. HS19]MYM63246.1 protein kinase [Pseudomaricurvus sp. HS19]
MIQIPGYRVIRLLGKGGMAEVYLAIQQSFGREVALKVLSPTLAKDRSFSERFLREARIVSRLVHPNIVTVYDVGVADGRHYLSMEYIPGEDLKQARSRLNLEQRLNVVRDIARALAFAGRKGYVHRDVKPENILLHEDDGRAVLMDFGIARTANLKSGMTQTGTAIGTPHYMSPEQAKGQEVDPRSDLYSLGVVLFFLLSGRVPFDADSVVAVGVKHVADPIPQLPEPMQRFQSIIDRAMAKDPAHRFQSGDEFIAALDQIPAAELERIKSAMLMGKGRMVEADADAPTLMSLTPVATGGSRPVAAPTVRVKRTPPAAAPRRQTAARGVPPKAAPAAPVTVVAERTSHSLWPWLAGIFIASLIAYVVYFQQQLPVEERIHLPQHLLAHWRAVAREVGGEKLAGLLGEEVPEVAAGTDEAAGAGSDSAAAEQAAKAAAEAQAAREQQLKQAQEWLRTLEQQPQQAADIVGLSRQLLQQDSEDGDALALLDQFRQRYQWLFDTTLAAADTEAAGEWLTRLERDFGSSPELQERLQVVQTRIARQRQIGELLTEAAALAQDKAWTLPADNSALQRYRAVLALEPGNADALEGIEQLVELLERQARQQMGVSQWPQAQQSLQEALSIDGDNRQLQKLLAQVETRQQVLSLMRRARQLGDQGKLLGHGDDSVYSITGKVLKLQPGHAGARAMRRDLEDGLVGSVEGLLQSQRYDDVRAELARALSYFPASERLQSLKSANEAAIKEANRPLVEQLRVSNQPIDDLSGLQVAQFPTVRQLHVGFLYRRFDAAGSAVTAHLYEGADAIEVAQTEVTLSRSEGEQYFRLASPLREFAADAYRLELRMEQQVLAQLVFRLTEPAPETSDSAASQ